MCNFHAVQVLVSALVSAAAAVSLSEGITAFGVRYRKRSPGFEHANYMKRPSAALHAMIIEQLHEWRATEERNHAKHALFLSLLGRDLARQHMPWLRDDPTMDLTTAAPIASISVYNSVTFASSEHVGAFERLAKQHGIFFLPNPTYVSMSASRDPVTAGIVERLHYLPSVAGMREEQIRALARLVARFSSHSDRPPKKAPRTIFEPVTILVAALALLAALLGVAQATAVPHRLHLLKWSVPCAVALCVGRSLSGAAVERVWLGPAPSTHTLLRRQAKVEKTGHCLFKLLYHVAVVLAFYILPRVGVRAADAAPTPLLTSEMIDGQSTVCLASADDDVIGADGHAYIIISLGNALHNLAFLVLLLPSRPDYWEMLMHHLMAITLIFTSYLVGWLRVAAAVLFLHDVPDIFVYALKAAAEVDAPPLAIVSVFTGLVTCWGYMRLWMFPRDILAPCFEAIRAQPNLAQSFLFSFLCLLLGLHIYWFYLFWCMGLTFAMGGRARDVQDEEVTHHQD